MNSFHAFCRSMYAFAGRRLPVTASLAICAALMEGLGIVMLLPALELFAGEADSDTRRFILALFERLGIVSPSHQVSLILAAFIVVLVMRGLAFWQRDVRIMALSEGFVDHWRLRIFKAVANAPWSESSRLVQSDVEHGITNDVTRVAIGTDRALRGTAASAILVTQVAIAIAIAPIASLLIILWFGIAAVVLRPFIGRARRSGEELTLAGRDVHLILGSFLSGLKLAKAHNAVEPYVDEFAARLARARAQLVLFTRDQAGVVVFFQILAGLTACVIVALGLFVLDTPIVVLGVLLLILARLTVPMQNILRGFQAIVHALPAFESIRELEAGLQARTAMADSKQSAEPSLNFAEDAALLSLVDVSYGHPDSGDLILDKVNLDVRIGDKLAIVGASGSGKTTLVDLIAGLIEPVEGRILVGGDQLCRQLAPVWQQHIAYVLQNGAAPYGTVRDNLLLGNAPQDDAALWGALEQARLSRLVSGLPGGLDSLIGGAGRQLSGGELQRLAIARALLRRPKLLLLDEATNAIDNAVEVEIHQILEPLRANMAVIAITHGATFNRRYDAILRL